MAFYLPGNEPEHIKNKLKSFFEKLEEYYPDKLVMGIYNDHKHLGEKLTALYRDLGYDSGREFLNAYGYGYSSKSRKKVVIQEEDLIRQTEEFFNLLKDYYPNGLESTAQITREHPELKKTLMSVNKYLKTKESSVKIELNKRGLGVVKNHDITESASAKVKPVNYVKIMNNEIKKLKSEIYSVCKYPKMFCSIEDIKEENEKLKVIVEIIEEIAKNLTMTTEELKSKFEEERFVGESAIKFKAEGLTPTDISYFEIDEKGKLLSCSLSKKYSWKSKHKPSADELVDVVIPPGVTSIKPNTFEDWHCLHSIYIPDGVRSIGGYVCRGCISLESVRLPADLTNIPVQAFRNCRSIKTLELPDKITNIGSQVFDDCKSLVEISLPSGIETIGPSNFSGSPKLKKVTGSYKTFYMLEKNWGYNYFKHDVELNIFDFSVPSEKTVSENFYQFAFSEDTSYEPKRCVICYDLYKIFREYELVNRSFKIIGQPDISEFNNAMKESVQNITYSYGEEKYMEWLFDISDIGYDQSFLHASYTIMLFNASFITRKYFNDTFSDGSKKIDSGFYILSGKVTIEELMSIVRIARVTDKDFEMHVHVQLGKWCNNFCGYSFKIKKGMYYPRTIYLNYFI